MIAFERQGTVNTDETLKIAINAAIERNLDIVVATTKGDTVFKLLEVAKEAGFSNDIVAVTHVYGMYTPGENTISKEQFDAFKENGVKVVTAAHALSGGERGLSRVYKGIYPVEIVAAALKMLGQGVKVCVEVAMMALDNGSIAYKKPVVCIAGTGRGADTVCIVTPSYTASLLDTKVNEVLCKPSLYPEEKDAE